ncbi:hypothetical protein J7E57_06990 [Pedobacter sp. ISL-64]|nr:hypothetical protein [Pedobacter sp. ISL-64]
MTQNSIWREEIAPWLLFDYRSLGRMHPVYQKGYNRKGLLSERVKGKWPGILWNNIIKANETYTYKKKPIGFELFDGHPQRFWPK